MNVPTTVSFKNMSDVIRGLAKVSGESVPRIVDFEASKVLEKCISLTPASNEAKITANALDREWGNHKLQYIPKRKFRGKLSKNGFKRYRYDNRYPDPVWTQISEQRLASIRKRVPRAGLSKASWYRLAQVAGLTVKAPNYVKNAKPKIDANAAVRRVRQTGVYSINFRNAQPTIQKIGGTQILRRALNGRAAYFRKNMEKGVLDDMAKFAKAYPGLVTVHPIGGQLE